MTNIKILLHFSASPDEDFQFIAFWCLKDHILFNKKHSQLVKESMSSIYHSLVNGCISSNRQIQFVCSQALSFLVTQRQFYNQSDEEVKLDQCNQQIEQINEQLTKLNNQTDKNDLQPLKIQSFNNKKSFLEQNRYELQRKFQENLDQIEQQDPTSYLDAIMMLSGSEDKEIRSTAFSSLSSLSEYSSAYESIMQQIKRDIEIPRDGLSNT